MTDKRIYWGRHRTHELSDASWSASDSITGDEGPAPRHAESGAGSGARAGAGAGSGYRSVARTYDHRAAIEECLSIEGVTGVAIVDLHTGTVLTRANQGDVAAFEREASGHAVMVRAKVATLVELGLEDDVEDILMSSRRAYGLVRPVTNAPAGWDLFFYMSLDREDANLAMARYRLARIDASLQL